MFDPITSRIDLALAAMNSSLPTDTPELDLLFERLRTTTDKQARSDVEQRIWAIWCSHEETIAATSMKNVMDSFEAGDLEDAGNTLDGLIERWPGWAEAWNKRATLRFAQEHDAESLDDIVRTLELEPRHFGALSGFGQICLRAGDYTSALLAFERVLVIDPNLPEVHKAVELLRKQAQPTIH